jgi:hypothetical protein
LWGEAPVRKTAKSVAYFPPTARAALCHAPLATAPNALRPVDNFLAAIFEPSIPTRRALIWHFFNCLATNATTVARAGVR